MYKIGHYPGSAFVVGIVSHSPRVMRDKKVLSVVEQINSKLDHVQICKENDMLVYHNGHKYMVFSNHVEADEVENLYPLARRVCFRGYMNAFELS